MRNVVLALCVLSSTSTVARAEDHRQHVLRTTGKGLLIGGIVASVAGSVLAGTAVSWQLGNSLGEHYDPTPSWVPGAEIAGWSLLGGGQALVISGITMLCVRF